MSGRDGDPGGCFQVDERRTAEGGCPYARREAARLGRLFLANAIVGYFLLVAAFFLLNPVSTDAPMLASMSLAGCAY